MGINVILEVLIIGLILSADSFSAAIAMGLRRFSRKDAIKFALSSGIAEGLIALFGALSGSYIVKKFSAIDHWIAFGVLAMVALHMAYEGIVDLKSKEIKPEKLEFHSFTKILIVSVATSLDAFGVGVGLGIAEKPIAGYIASITFWAFVTTIAGLYLAKKLSKKFGPIVTLFGAAILFLMALQMLKI